MICGCTLIVNSPRPHKTRGLLCPLWNIQQQRSRISCRVSTTDRYIINELMDNNCMGNGERKRSERKGENLELGWRHLSGSFAVAYLLCRRFQNGAMSAPLSRGNRCLYWTSHANEAARLRSVREGRCLKYTLSVWIWKSSCVFSPNYMKKLRYIDHKLSYVLPSALSHFTASPQTSSLCSNVYEFICNR